MDLKPGKWKLNFMGGKDKWLVVLAVGMILLILAFPAGGKKGGSGGAGNLGTGNLTAGNPSAGDQWSDGGAGQNPSAGSVWSDGGTGQNLSAGSQWADSGAGGGNLDTREAGAKAAAAKGTLTYEQQLEERLKELLSHVEGVGKVEVMIVLKSSEEKVWRVDRNTSYSSTQETDANGGTRDIRSQETTEGTILSGQSGGEGPLLEKEMRPEISGVVVTADGGGSPTIQAEISAAVEALFDVPSHKIKVLKRAE